jgi:ribosomal protein L29
MRKEELDRRSAELKARIIAERNKDARKKPVGAAARESVSLSKQADKGETKPTEAGGVAALKKRIAKLEAENETLRQQLASTNYQTPSSSRSYDDSVREQQHNFFKYSNLRRY